MKIILLFKCVSKIHGVTSIESGVRKTRPMDSKKMSNFTGLLKYLITLYEGSFAITSCESTGPVNITGIPVAFGSARFLFKKSIKSSKQSGASITIRSGKLETVFAKALRQPSVISTLIFSETSFSVKKSRNSAGASASYYLFYPKRSIITSTGEKDEKLYCVACRRQRFGDGVFRFARLFYTRQNLKLKMTQDIPFWTGNQSSFLVTLVLFFPYNLFFER